MDAASWDFNSTIDMKAIATEQEFKDSCSLVIELSKKDRDPMDEVTLAMHYMRTGACLINIFSFLYKLNYEETTLFSIWIKQFIDARDSLILDTINSMSLDTTREQLERAFSASMPPLPEQDNKEGN